MFHSIPEPNSGCWIWTAQVNRGNYGRLTINNKTLTAHKVLWEEKNGKIPKGIDLDHKCRVRCCVNPDHLEPVTRLENVKRGMKGILRTHCKNGHELTFDNIKIWRNRRNCKICYRKWSKETKYRLRMRKINVAPANM